MEGRRDQEYSPGRLLIPRSASVDDLRLRKKRVEDLQATLTPPPRIKMTPRSPEETIRALAETAIDLGHDYIVDYVVNLSVKIAELAKKNGSDLNKVALICNKQGALFSIFETWEKFIEGYELDTIGDEIDELMRASATILDTVEAGVYESIKWLPLMAKEEGARWGKVHRQMVNQAKTHTDTAILSQDIYSLFKNYMQRLGRLWQRALVLQLRDDEELVAQLTTEPNKISDSLIVHLPEPAATEIPSVYIARVKHEIKVKSGESQSILNNILECYCRAQHMTGQTMQMFAEYIHMTPTLEASAIRRMSQGRIIDLLMVADIQQSAIKSILRRAIKKSSIHAIRAILGLKPYLNVTENPITGMAVDINSLLCKEAVDEASSLEIALNQKVFEDDQVHAAAWILLRQLHPMPSTEVDLPISVGAVIADRPSISCERELLELINTKYFIRLLKVIRALPEVLAQYNDESPEESFVDTNFNETIRNALISRMIDLLHETARNTSLEKNAIQYRIRAILEMLPVAPCSLITPATLLSSKNAAGHTAFGIALVNQNSIALQEILAVQLQIAERRIDALRLIETLPKTEVGQALSLLKALWGIPENLKIATRTAIISLFNRSMANQNMALSLVKALAEAVIANERPESSFWCILPWQSPTKTQKLQALCQKEGVSARELLMELRNLGIEEDLRIGSPTMLLASYLNCIVSDLDEILTDLIAQTPVPAIQTNKWCCCFGSDDISRAEATPLMSEGTHPTR